MRDARLFPLALVASVAVAASTAGRAETVTAPFTPPARVSPDVPPEVGTAFAAFRQACAVWPRPKVTALSPVPKPASNAVQPSPNLLPDPDPITPERTLCNVARDPDAYFQTALTVGGFAGAGLLFVALVVFSLLRGILISAWNWRLPIRSRAW